ncbi:MAG TPA: amidohydrolase/deacetylase family metallohydrolase [Terriglobia bacterium]|nr:amidohydrolase/deacetylase family metallohydrolase [Terriglobia bacterium]
MSNPRSALKYLAATGLSVSMAAGLGPAQTPRYDLVVKGGHVIDPANRIDSVMDVAVTDGKIAAVESGIPASQAGKVVDASGLYVTPGLVDIHVHVGNGGAPLDWFTPTGRAHIQPWGIPADLFLTYGVTTAVDAGSSGADTFLALKQLVMDNSKVRVLAFLNIVADGMSGGLEQDVDQMDVQKCLATIKEYRQYIVGVKTAHYWTSKPWDDLHQPWAAVDRAEACGKEANLPVMFDFWPRLPERSYDELILSKMRPGDIHTHVFAQQFPIVLENGKVNPMMWEARKRGVIFDVGHGAGSFWFRNAVPAAEQGFYPDSISTDIHSRSYVAHGVNMIDVMSKFLAMGMPLEDVIRRSTVNPAREINRPELGTLSPGRAADIAVLEVLHGKFSYSDDGYARLDGTVQLLNRMTIAAGRILYDPSGLSMVEWTKARKQYFTAPASGEGPPSRADDYPRD